MPDSKAVGWRRKINSISKETTGSKTDDETALLEDMSDRRRHHGWRKTLHGSRPQTPANSAPSVATLLTDDGDTRSERSEVSTPGRNSRPKLARYTSLFGHIKDSSKELGLSKPWGEDIQPILRPYVDPLVALQSVRTHMMNSSSTPIPLEHNSGLFRVFEDYRKVREEKERLESLVQETLQDWKKEQDQWSESERGFQTEIRRLDLLIARGISGMAGLMRARQDSVIDRKRRQRKPSTNDKLAFMPETLSAEQLEREIKSMSKRALLYRPNSPSTKMATLSRQFSGTANELPVGTPLQDDWSGTLLRKVESELNLSSLTQNDPSLSTSDPFGPTFSDRTGGLVSDETSVVLPSILESATECDVLVALRELSTLVARRRGLNIDDFVEGLMMLLSKTGESTACMNNIRKEEPHLVQSTDHREKGRDVDLDGALTPRRNNLRRFQSQPQLSSDQKRRRHFSFEPGDDQLRALQEEHKEGEPSETDTIGSDSSSSSQPISVLSLHSNESKSFQTLIVDHEKPSKIPSPVQTLGRVRHNSNSSLYSSFTKPNHENRNSRSSVLTAFHKDSMGNFRSNSDSRNSSMHNLQDVTDPASGPKTQSGSLKSRNSIIALAAARAAGGASKTLMMKEGSPMRNTARLSKPRISSLATPNAEPTEMDRSHPSDWV